MAEAMIGKLSEIVRVKRAWMSASDGITSERPGCNRTSSNVNASRNRLSTSFAMANSGSAPGAENETTRAAGKRPAADSSGD
jgi:hypothetical protein